MTSSIPDDSGYKPEMVIVWSFGSVLFWAAVAAVAILLSGCASAPPDLLKVQDEVRTEMRYEWNTSKKDVWNPHCPAVGDCEDVAMCMYLKLLKTHPQARLLRVQWWRSMGVAHMMVKVDDWWMDYNGVGTLQPRGEPTHECVLNAGLTVATCSPLLPGEKTFVRILSHGNE